MWMLETESLFLEEEHSNAVQSLRWEEETKAEIKTFADEPNSGTKEQLYSPITKAKCPPLPQKSQILNTLNSTSTIRKKRKRRVNLKRLCNLK